MKEIILICFLSVTIYGVNSLQFIDCGSKVGKFTKISVSNCDTTKPQCDLRKNTNATIAIDFTLQEDCSEVNTVVHGKILGREIPFNLENPNACIGSGLNCPIKKGRSYEYTATLPILRIYPKVSVLVKWQLQNHAQEDIVCVLIPAKIV